MTAIRRGKRGGRSTRRIELSAMRQALADGLVWSALGIVEADGGSHYSIDEEDLLVEVRLIPGDEPVTARMGVCGGGPLAGVWTVPPVGSEVALLIPSGELEASPIIVGILSTGSVPDGVAPDTIVIASPQVLVHDGNGGASPLATLADLEAHKTWVAAHVHTDPTAGLTGVPTTAPPTPAGTEVLKAQ